MLCILQWSFFCCCFLNRLYLQKKKQRHQVNVNIPFILLSFYYFNQNKSFADMFLVCLLTDLAVLNYFDPNNVSLNIYCNYF